MKRWKEDLKSLVGLDYILFKNVPMRPSEHGPVIEHRIPIRGKEVKFL